MEEFIYLKPELTVFLLQIYLLGAVLNIFYIASISSFLFLVEMITEKKNQLFKSILKNIFNERDYIMLVQGCWNLWIINIHFFS